MSLLAAAIRLGLGCDLIDWCAATEVAAWEDSRSVRAACDQVSPPSDDSIRERALAMLADGTACIDQQSPLRTRLKWAMEDAAAQIIAEEAQEILEAEREANFAAEEAIADRKNECAALIFAALGDRVEQTSDGYGGFGSLYFRYRSRTGLRVSIRVSDHAQVSGGGWNSETGERNGESDISFVIDSPEDSLPSREVIRSRVAIALCEMA